LLLALLVIGSSIAAADGPVFSETTLDNGLRVILVESPGSSLIASTVFIRAGAMRETEALNGAAHFLEHLLFNGTTHRTQEQLYDDVDMIGAYNNATTQKDFAIFLFVVGKESAREGLEIQSDMLFNSTLPPEKFEKERGIVIEEIGKDMDNADYLVGLAMDEALYAGTSYARPILGSVESIQGLPREDVLDYYHAYYVPSNMTLLVMGDFVSQEMLDLVRETFGAAAATDPPPSPAPLRRIEGGRVVHRSLDAGSLHLTIRIPAPMPGDKDYLAFEFLEQILGGEGSRMSQACDLEPTLRTESLSAGLSLVGGRSFFDIDATFGTDVDVEALTERLTGELFRLTADDVSMLELATARVSKRTEEIGLRQQLHYYSFMRGALIAHAPPGFLAGQMERYREATIGDIRSAAERWFEDPPLIIVAAGPGLTDRNEMMTAADVGFRLPPHELPEEPESACDISIVDPLPPPRTEVDSPPKHITLSNGMTLVLSSNRSSDILAMHLMALGRSYRESPDNAGITDVLHRLLTRGAGEWDRAEFNGKLDAIGASVKTGDSPWIPYDDYYTTPEFSFVRFETLDEYYERAFELLGLMITAPRLDTSEIEEVRQEMMALIGKRDASARGLAKLAYREALYGRDHPAAKAVSGTMASISSITREDLVAHHSSYFAPSNLVLTVVTGLPEAEVVAAVERAFTFPPRMAADSPEAWSTEMPLAPTGTVARSEQDLGKQQSRITLGYPFEFETADEAALHVANIVLSDRMAFQLRERQGLAYSIGSSFSSWGTRGVLTAGMGTRPDNVDLAETGMAAQIDSLSLITVDEADITKAVNARIGRMRMRRVSRMGQAFYLSMDVLHGKPLLAHEELLSAMRHVTADDVRRVAEAYFDSDRATRVIVR